MGQWVALHAQKRDTFLSLHCPRCRLAWWKSMYFDALWLSGLVHTQLPLHLGYRTTDVHWLPVCWRQLALQMWVLMMVSVVCSITTRWFSIGHQRKTPPWLECSNCNIALETLWVLPFPFFLCMVCFWMVAWPLFKARGGCDWLAFSSQSGEMGKNVIFNGMEKENPHELSNEHQNGATTISWVLICVQIRDVQIWYGSWRHSNTWLWTGSVSSFVIGKNAVNHTEVTFPCLSVNCPRQLVK